MKRLCSYCELFKVHLNVLDKSGRIFNCDKHKNKFLCDFTDVRHLELMSQDQPTRTPFSIQDLEQVAEQITRNTRDVLNILKEHYFDLPNTYHEFEQLLIVTHEQFFKDTSILYLGKFRINDVSVDVDIHEFSGTPFLQIQNELQKLWVELLEKKFAEINSGKKILKKDAVYLASHFLTQFFRIHPFRDGNGRVGRYVVKAILLKCGFDILFNTPYGKTEAQQQRKYIKALRYSHKRYSNTNWSQVRYEDRILTRFINRWIWDFLYKLTLERISIEEDEFP